MKKKNKHSRLNIEAMVTMAEVLLSEAIEKVLEEIGSPPFPKLNHLKLIRDDLNSYIKENKKALDSINY